MIQRPRGPKDLICPLHKKQMFEVCDSCPWWTLIRGKHPQTAEEIDRWDCAISTLPILVLEGSQQTRQAGSAIESFRNEMVKANNSTLELMARSQQNRLEQ